MLTKKTKNLRNFLDGLTDFIEKHPQFRKVTAKKSEQAVQTEIRPIIISYLEKYFREIGYVDYVAKANNAFYWEGQESGHSESRKQVFASRNYPDFIIQSPYVVAIEYKKSSNGSLVKQALGQSMMHTLSGEYDFSLILFHDENSNKKISKSATESPQTEIIQCAEKDLNIFIRFL